MSTPESPATAPEQDERVKHLLGELASKLSSPKVPSTNQGDEVAGPDALEPQDLPSFRQAIQGAAIRTGAAYLLYRSEADSSDISEETAAPEIPDSYSDPGSALAGTEALTAIMADVQQPELEVPGRVPTQLQ